MKTLKITAFLFILLICNNLFAQENNKNYDLKIGVGSTIFGMGDILCLNIENELNFKINNYFSTSAALVFGHGNWQTDKRASFINANFNAFLSPFKNNKTNNFRIGTGLTAITLASTTLFYKREINGIVVESSHLLRNASSFGYNIIIENEKLISKKFLIGIKIFMQDYFNGDSNGGIMFKFGIKI